MTWATSVPIVVFLGLSVLELGPMNATDRRQTSDRRQTKASLNAYALWGLRDNNKLSVANLSSLPENPDGVSAPSVLSRTRNVRRRRRSD